MAKNNENSKEGLKNILRDGYSCFSGVRWQHQRVCFTHTHDIKLSLKLIHDNITLRWLC